jgi:oligosaccharide repeat unit polymerase
LRKFLLSPTGLFFIGALQSVLPYIHWQFFGKNINYDYDISYLPFLLTFVGCLAFFIGCIICKVPVGQSYALVNIPKVKKILFFLTLILIIQLILLYNLYGGYPIAMYINGNTTVGDINAIQSTSIPGQVGLANITNFAVLGALQLLMIGCWQQNRKIPYLWYFLLGLLIFSFSFSGKRQGLVQIFEFIYIGFSCITNKPFKIIICLLISKLRRFYIGISASIMVMIVIIFSYIESMRNNAFELSPYNSYISYLEWPLINFEEYFTSTPFYLIKLNIAGLFGGIIPYKLAEKSELMNWTILSSPLLEPSAGLGFIGINYYNFGLIGMIFFAFFSGMLAKYFYLKSRGNLFYVLCYSQISWTLLFCHTYNFMLSLSFLWAPIFIYFILCKYSLMENQ